MHGSGQKSSSLIIIKIQYPNLFILSCHPSVSFVHIGMGTSILGVPLKKRGRARWWGGGCGIKFQCWTASELNDAVLQLTFSCNHEGRGQNQRNGIRPMGLAEEMTDLGPIDGCQGIFASASACRRREYIEILYREYNNS